VFRLELMEGMLVDTEVVSMKETNKATERAGMATRRRLGESSLVWLPMLWMLALSDRVELESSAPSGTGVVSFSLVSVMPLSRYDGEASGGSFGVFGSIVGMVVRRCGPRIR